MTDKKYWAADNVLPAEGKKFVDVLEEKVRLYHRGLKSGVQWRRLIRMLQYYHGNFYPRNSDSISFEMKTLEGGHIGVGVNHFRNLLDQILLIACGDRIKFKSKAVNSDADSLEQAILADGLMDYYVCEKKLQKITKTAAQHAMVLNAGFTYCYWDRGLGSAIDEDPQTGEKFYEGDFVFENPTIVDVTFDHSAREWEKIQWVIIRTLVNKWDLAAKFPGQADAIINSTIDKSSELWFYQGLNYLSSDDMIYKYELYHKQSPALPVGRHTVYVPGAILLDEQNPYFGLPIFRCAHGEFLLNCLGYSVGNDLQVLQEGINGAVSSITTALSAHGVGHIWMRPGDRLTAKNFEGGLRALVSENEPKPVNFTAIPPELWKAADLYVRAMEYLSGINSVRRGQPEASLRTGKALQIVAAQALEASSSFAESYRQMCEDLATFMIRTLCEYGQGSRMVSIVGKSNVVRLRSFQPRELTQIDRVQVEAVNPIAGTVFGRVAIADDLSEKQLLKNYREFITVQQTGNLEPILAFEQGQLTLVHEENERLQQGVGVLALPIHPHVLHIKEHSTILSNLQTAENAAIRDIVIAHIMDHVEQWMSPVPQYQALQAALSAEPPPMMAPMMGPQAGIGGPEGGPPGPGPGGPGNNPSPGGPVVGQSDIQGGVGTPPAAGSGGG